VADKDVQIDIVVGAEGTVGAVKALDSVTAALTDIRGGGGRVTSTMRAIASAADRMGGRVAASAGSVEAAAKSLATLRNTAASLQEAYSAIAAANVGASPKQRLEMFGEDNVRALIASQEALSANAIKDYNEVANAAAETARLQRIETERVAAAIRSNELAALREVIQARSRLLEQGRNSRSNGFAAVQEQEYKNLLASMSPLEAAQRRLTDATANEARARAAATSAGASYAAAVRHYGKGSMEAAEAAIRHGAALQELARAMGATRTAQANLNTVTERAERGLRDMGDEAGRAEVRVQALQYALFYTSFTLAAMAAVGVKSLKAVFGASIELESQFAQVQRTVADFSGETRESLEALGAEIPVTLESITEIATLGGALNVGAENIVNFTKTIAILTATTNLTEQAAGTLLGRMGALLDLSADGSDFERIGAAVLAVGAQSAATESQVAAMAAQVAGLGKNIGLSAPEIIGWSGALASVGVSAELGRSSLQRIFNVLNKNARAGGVELEALGRITGQTAREFRDSLGRSASDALLSVVEGLSRMTAEGEDTVKVLNEIGIRNVRDVYALQQLAAAYKNTANVIDLANGAFENAGETMDRYYGPISATTAARIQILETSWRRFLDAVGSSSTGPLNDIIRQLTEMVNGVREFTEANPELAAMVVNWIATATAILLAAGVLAQIGSSAANFLFVQQQLKAVLDGINAATLPAFIRNILVKTKVLDADTVSTQLNAAANARAATATSSFGAAALATGKNIAAGIGKLGIWAAILSTLGATANLIINAFLKPQATISDFYESIGRGDPIIAHTTRALTGLAMGLLGITEGYYNLRAAVDDLRGADGQAINENDPYYLNLKQLKGQLDEAMGGLNRGMEGTAVDTAEAIDLTEKWGDTLDEASQQALVYSGNVEYMTMATDEVPESVKDATERLVSLSQAISQASTDYLGLTSVIERFVSKNDEGDFIGLGGIGDPTSGQALDEILTGMVTSNNAVQAFQQNLFEIGNNGGMALVTALSAVGVEQASGIAQALVGNPELQRQFGVQARIAGLLANAEFVRAFSSGASDRGISDAVATEVAGLTGDMGKVFAAIEASSYGIGSEQWNKFVTEWNAEQTANPLSLDSFDFAPTEAGGNLAQEIYEMVQDQFSTTGVGPDGQPMRIEVPIDPGFLIDERGQTPEKYAGIASTLVSGLQAQLDAKVITPPMAFDTIAVTNGYTSWQEMVARNPTLAKINTSVAPDSVANMIAYIRQRLAYASFNIDVRGNVRPVLQQGKVGVYANREGGWIDQYGMGHFAGGGGWGLVRGRGTGTSDSNLSWLSKGEYVQPAKSTGYYGVDMMDAIRARRFPTIDQWGAMLRSAAVSGNSGPQSVTNVAVTQMYPQTVDPLKKLREDSENVVAGLFG